MDKELLVYRINSLLEHIDLFKYIQNQNENGTSSCIVPKI